MMLDGKAQVNMTPTIDILLAPANREQPPPAGDIVITVRADGTVRLNQEPVDVAQLRQRHLRARREGAGVSLRRVTR
ncbi:MAG TPA: hypothetical protein VN924_25615 [Bryobacteraceae bacterium]|nr:hypothetical protein [Bryobacteraceae bacterium]